MSTFAKEMLRIYGFDKLSLDSIKVARELTMDDFASPNKPRICCILEGGRVLYCGSVSGATFDDGRDSFVLRFSNLIGISCKSVVHDASADSMRVSAAHFNKKRRTLKQIVEEESGYMIFEPLPLEAKRWTKSELIQELKMRL